MTFKELKDDVGQLIGRNKTEEAIDEIIKWAKGNFREQMKKEATVLRAKLSALNREIRLGLISTSDTSIKQSQISYGVLSLFENENYSIQDDTKDKSLLEKIKILMLTSNPANTTKLNLDKEYAFITQKLQQKRELFNIILKKAVSGSEFKEFTQKEMPYILHFSGHGEAGKYPGIVLQNDDKNGEDLIPINGLKSLFKFFKKHLNIKVVLLNACYTQEQAAAISEFVDYVIGTNVKIGDDAASAFSSGFYFQLAEDNPMNIEDAFDSGRTEAALKGADEGSFVIYRKGELITIS